MRRSKISEGAREVIREKQPCQLGYKGKWTDNRLFVNAALYVAKCGIPWRDLPERFGNRNMV